MMTSEAQKQQLPGQPPAAQALDMTQMIPFPKAEDAAPPTSAPLAFEPLGFDDSLITGSAAAPTSTATTAALSGATGNFFVDTAAFAEHLASVVADEKKLSDVRSRCRRFSGCRAAEMILMHRVAFRCRAEHYGPDPAAAPPVGCWRPWCRCCCWRGVADHAVGASAGSDAACAVSADLAAVGACAAASHVARLTGEWRRQDRDEWRWRRRCVWGVSGRIDDDGDQVDCLDCGHQREPQPCRSGEEGASDIAVTDCIRMILTVLMLLQRKSGEAFGDTKSERGLPTPTTSSPLSTATSSALHHGTNGNVAALNASAAAAAAAREKVMKEPQSGDLYECVITKRNGGLGLTLACVDDHVQITGLAPDTPAANSGICVGDTLVAVSGLPVRGLQFSTVIGRLKSTSRNSVVLKLRRNPCKNPLLLG